MAVAFESVATTGWATATSVTITKPTGLAAGDLMVVHIATVSGIDLHNATALSGWSNLAGEVDAITTTGSVSGRVMAFQYKIASAGDAAATNFTWTLSGSASCAGALFRLSGHATPPITSWNQAKVDNSATPSFANGITPISPNSLLLMCGMGRDGNVGGGSTVEGYAIVTDDPTWTERYDVGFDAGSEDPGLWGATASRAAITATGNSTASVGSSSRDTFCYLIAVNAPAGDADLEPDAVALVSTAVDPEITHSAVLAPVAGVLQAALPNPTLITKDNPWNNPDKPAAASSTNTEKNAANWTNSAKSSAGSITNTPKT